MDTQPVIGRRGVLAAAGLAGLSSAGLSTAMAPSASAATTAVRPLTARAALKRLLDGNARFATGHARHRSQDVTASHVTAAGQHPFVITLGCSDSRVPPEIVFDEGIGGVFDQRVAGGIVDDAILGSIEFAVGEFAPPLLLVLGHERCGAVSAAVKAVASGGQAPEHVQSIVEAIRPAVLAVAHQPGDRVENAVQENARRVARDLVRRSSIIRRAVRGGTLTVRAARYDLDNGRITVL